jgi:hypothetical protein
MAPATMKLAIFSWGWVSSIGQLVLYGLLKCLMPLQSQLGMALLGAYAVVGGAQASIEPEIAP